MYHGPPASTKVAQLVEMACKERGSEVGSRGPENPSGFRVSEKTYPTHR